MPSDCACSACDRNYGTAGNLVVGKYQELEKELEKLKKENFKLKTDLQRAAMNIQQVVDVVLKDEGLI